MKPRNVKPTISSVTISSVGASIMLQLLSRFLRALFQFSKRAAGEATKFGRSGVKLLGVVGAARLECGEPAAESGELIRRQLGNSFGNFFDFHGDAVDQFKFVYVRRRSTSVAMGDGVLAPNDIRKGIFMAGWMWPFP